MADEKKNILGLLAAGLVMAKNRFAGVGKPDRYSVDLAVPGIREMLTITVPFDLWNSLSEMQEWKTRLVFRTYKGNVYFEAV